MILSTAAISVLQTTTEVVTGHGASVQQRETAATAEAVGVTAAMLTGNAALYSTAATARGSHASRTQWAAPVFHLHNPPTQCMVTVHFHWQSPAPVNSERRYSALFDITFGPLLQRDNALICMRCIACAFMHASTNEVDFITDLQTYQLVRPVHHVGWR